MKNWHVFWHVGTPSWNTGTLYGALARLLARWHVKMRSWDALGTLSRKPCWHASTLARRPRWHVDHVGTQTRKARDLANSLSSLDLIMIFSWFLYGVPLSWKVQRLLEDIFLSRMPRTVSLKVFKSALSKFCFAKSYWKPSLSSLSLYY